MKVMAFKYILLVMETRGKTVRPGSSLVSKEGFTKKNSGSTNQQKTGNKSD